MTQLLSCHYGVVLSTREAHVVPHAEHDTRHSTKHTARSMHARKSECPEIVAIDPGRTSRAFFIALRDA